MMEEGTTQEKQGRHKVVYPWCDSTRNKEPKKKKGTLCKPEHRGGGFEKFSKSGDITSIQIF